MDLERPYEGFIAGGEHHYAIRVFFEDTDAGGGVYHANYLRYMERARSDMLRAVGIDHKRAIEDGVGVYVVADLQVRYRSPAWLEDAIVVRTRVVEVRAACIVVHQRVMRGDEVLSEGTVTVALTREGRPIRQPREWAETFERLKRGE